MNGGAEIIAYCLMTNHFHLALKVGAVTLSAIMQRLLTSYVSWFNRKHARTGHLFEARYQAKLCRDDAYLRNVIRYIHYNPVKAGLVKDPRDWPWSSARDFGQDACADPGHFDPWARAETAAILNRTELGLRRSIASIATAHCDANGLSISGVSSPSKRRDFVAAKRTIAIESVKEGHSMTAVADYFGISVKAISRYVETRGECSNSQA